MKGLNTAHKYMLIHLTEKSYAVCSLSQWTLGVALVESETLGEMKQMLIAHEY